MKTPTLESVLEEKYNIREKFEAIGMFVAFPSSSREPSGLVKIGLNSRCLVVARVDLSGQVVTYDLVSLTPVSLVSIDVHDYMQNKISVVSPFKATSWVYQQCTSEDQDEIWDEFLCAIGGIHASSYSGPCQDPQASGDGPSGAAVIVPSGSITVQSQPIGGQPRSTAILCPTYCTQRSASMPDILPSSTSFQSQAVPRRHSIDVLYSHVKFDSFVNDNDSTATEISNANNSAEKSHTSMLEKVSSALKRLFRHKK